MSDYYKYLQEHSKSALLKHFANSGKSIDDVFTQGSINKFLNHHEIKVEEENKISTDGSTSESRILFLWTNNKADVQLRNLPKDENKEGGYINSKTIFRFLSGIVKRPQRACVLVIAQLFNALPESDYALLSLEEKRRLSMAAEQLLSRRNWKYWRDAAESATEMRHRIDIYLDGLTELPDNSNLVKNLAVTYYEIGNYNDAEKYLKKGVEISPNDADMYSNYGLFLHEIKNNYAKAEECYAKAYELDPLHKDNSLHYGWFLHAVKGRYAQAEEQYKIALKVNPKSVDALLDYGILLCFFLFNPTKGIAMLHKALKLSPLEPTVLGNVALAYTTYGLNFIKAESYYRTATSLQPSSYKKLANFAQLLFILGKNEEAFACIDIARKYIGNDYEVLLELEFYLYAHGGNLRYAAEKSLNKLLKKGYSNELKNFSSNIKAAIMQNHPDISSVIRFAKDISKLDYGKDGTLLLKHKGYNLG